MTTTSRFTPLLLAAVFGCAGDVLPPPVQRCDGGVDLSSMAPFGSRILRGADLTCIALPGDSEWILIPQLLGRSLPYVFQPFEIGAPGATIALVSARGAGALVATDSRAGRSSRLAHDFARRHEPLRRDRYVRLPGPATAVQTADPAARREFSVLASLIDPPQFSRVSASLRHSGAHVLIYVDDRSATAYTDAEIASLGAQFNDVLYAEARAAFGAESDIDRNERVIVLFTPTVNALVSAAECATAGYATGFFYGFDLGSAAAESNRGEVFYAFVPDPSGAFSCPHTKEDVAEVLPGTFIHELQHMISYGAHVLARGLEPEAPWLNEGLSHLAEELASLHYERKFPPPSGRSRPGQMFPDSAAPLIIGNIYNSYRFLRLSEHYSVVSCAPGSYCSTPERGGAWLFLRWLLDVTGDPMLTSKLVQSGDRDRENVELAVGRAFDELFGEFAAALWADSVAGVPRLPAGSRLRLETRNLRSIYGALYDAYGPLGGVPTPFPMTPIDVDIARRVGSAIRPGTVQPFRVRVPRGAGSTVTFTAARQLPFPNEAAAQLTALRVPSP